ncbi:MAG: DNA polymerase I [Candidatus Abyssobacteria bacterium SURF_5]|uniref:DNA polymerase I n=1 Tax=Abyssobacteria bacterium (strain SURF_5) TaxID=2093360 RepID=A0A3A4P6X8_ABYX5|nr:MAG: DNA polymerase I [Candidatus Abyssubacteria bacterium SURF_5]
MAEEKKKIYLIDGHSYAYRAFHAIRQLTDSSGLALNAVYGFTRMLLKFLKEEKPEYIAVAFDSPGETFRHEMYDRYKANRAEQPEEMRHQIPLIKEIVDAFNIVAFELQGYEADDLLATLAKKAAARGVETIIVTGDKDMLQLVSDGVKVLNPHRDNFMYDAQAVRERYGVGPEKMHELLAMAGDPIDNVPGVPGIGPKTAAQLLQEYGSLEGIYEHVDKISGPKRRQNLIENKDMAFLSRDLVAINSDVPIEVDIDACKVRKYDVDRLIDLFTRMEFRTLINEVAEAQEDRGADYSIITTEAELDSLMERIRRAGRFTLDFETTSQDPMKAKMVGISISVEPESASYIPVGHSAAAFAALENPAPEGELFPHRPSEQLRLDLVMKKLKSLAEDETIKKNGQNIKYEMVIFARNGIDLKGIEFDTMVASYLLNPSKLSHGLDQLALEFLNYRKIPLEKLIGKGNAQRSLDSVSVKEVSAYSCEDADVTLRLQGVLDPLLKEKGLYDLFKKVEIPLIRVLAKMELSGVCVDVDIFRALSARLAEQLQQLELEIYQLAGCEFNINSTQQLAKILFETLKLPAGKRTKTGYSTDVAILEKLAVDHECPRKVLDYRVLSKLKSTYIDTLPNLVNPQTGRIHTSFNQTVTATGRLSSSDPNLQNIPIRSGMGQEIRRAFIPCAEGNVIMSADYSQIELRILAHLSQDEELVRAFKEGIDIHDQTSSKIFQVPVDQVTGEMRRRAKIANYGILYGISAAKLAADIGIKLDEARDFIEMYFRVFPQVKRYVDSIIEEARRAGFVTTILNRRRYIPDINSQNFGVRRFAERTAVNTPIQGSAADLIKLAMIEIDRHVSALGLRAEMTLQVHDELVFDVPADEVDRLRETVKQIMETAYPMSVPIVADVRTGRNWLEAH